MKRVIFLLFTFALLNSECLAASAPAAALNKTVVVVFTINGMARRSTGGGEYGYNNIITRTIYVSSQGRVFAKLMNQAGRGRSSQSGEIGPDSKRESYHFQGNSLVGTASFQNGARQMTVTFDTGFTSCTVNLIEGRLAGKTLLRKSPSGDMVEVLSTTIGNPSCTINPGNAFAPG